MKMAYWRASGSSQFLSAFLLNEYKGETSTFSSSYSSSTSSSPSFHIASWPKIVITVDPSSVNRPFTTSHTPPMPANKWVGLDRSRLSLEELISTCVKIRSSAVLYELQAVLRGTVWEERGKCVCGEGG